MLYVSIVYRMKYSHLGGSSLSYDSESVLIWEQRKSSRGAVS